MNNVYIIPTYSASQWSLFLKTLETKLLKMVESVSVPADALGALLLSNVAVSEVSKEDGIHEMAERIGKWILGKRGSSVLSGAASVFKDDYDFGHKIRWGADTLGGTGAAASKGFAALICGLLGISVYYVSMSKSTEEDFRNILSRTPVATYGLLPWGERSALPLFSNSTYARAALAAIEDRSDSRITWLADRLAVSVMRPLCGTARKCGGFAAALAVSLPQYRYQEVSQDEPLEQGAFVSNGRVSALRQSDTIYVVPNRKVPQTILALKGAGPLKAADVEFGFDDVNSRIIEKGADSSASTTTEPASEAATDWFSVMPICSDSSRFYTRQADEASVETTAINIATDLLMPNLDGETAVGRAGSLHDWFGQEGVDLRVGPVHGSVVEDADFYGNGMHCPVLLADNAAYVKVSIDNVKAFEDFGIFKALKRGVNLKWLPTVGWFATVSIAEATEGTDDSVPGVFDLIEDGATVRLLTGEATTTAGGCKLYKITATVTKEA